MTGGAARWGTFGTLFWGAVIAVLFVFLQSVAIGAALGIRNPHFTDEQLMDAFMAAGENGFYLAVATLTTAVCCSAAVLVVIKFRKGSILRDYLCLHPVVLKTFGIWIGVLAGYIVIADSVTLLLGRPVVPDVMAQMYATADPVWLFWLAIVVAAPVFEELFFRGFLFSGFERGFLRPAGAVAVTTALWTVIHVQYDLYQMSLVFVFGIILGISRLKTGSLVVPVALHAIGNLVATVETALLA